MFDTVLTRLEDALGVASAESLDLSNSGELTESYVGLRRMIDRLEAEARCRLAEIDRRAAHAEQGYASPTAFVAHRCRMAGGRARRAVADARASAGMPIATKLQEAGELSSDQMRLLVQASEAEPDAYPESEALLCDLARDLERVSDLSRAVEYWRQAVSEPPLGDERYEERYLHISRTLDGMVKLDGLYDTEPGEVLIDALAAATPPPSEDDHRTPRQRRADALIDLVSTSTAGNAKRPQVQVQVGYDTLVGLTPGLSETMTGQVLTPNALRRLACNASVSRLVFGPDSQPLDVGRSVRTPPEAMRRAIVTRDRHCRFPGCDRPHWWCDAHHIEHWADGGSTSVDNLILLCRHHHRLVHEGGYRIHGPPGLPEFVSPEPLYAAA